MNKIYSTALILLLFATNSAFSNSFECFASHPKEETFDSQTILFSGNGNLPLAEKIANYLGTSLGCAAIKKYYDGEIQIQLEDSVQGKNVLILQSTCASSGQSVNDNLMELYLLVRTMKRAAAASITAIIPYYGYNRHDRKALAKPPVSAADVALFLEVAGVDRVVTVDLQCGQIQGFFRNIPVDNLYTSSLFVPYFAAKDLHNVVVASPDACDVDRAKNFAEGLENYGIAADLALIRKHSTTSEPAQSLSLVGNVKDADVILVADICDTASGLIESAKLLQELGANRVFAVITHPVFSDSALEKIGSSIIEEMVIADTVPLRETAPANVHSISVAPLLGTAIKRIQVGESLADLLP